MKSVKLTPIWMFILLLAILILSVLIGAQVSEGFTSRATYVETDVTGYANKVWPIVTSSIHFDKANGNIVLQTGATVDKIITRKGDETGTASSVIKLDTPLSTTVDNAWTSWTLDRTVSGTKQQIFYMPWDKTTFVHLVTDSVHASGFCFQGSSKSVGDYDDLEPGKTQTRGYASLDPVLNDRLETSVSVASKFIKPLYGLKSAGIFYDVSSGCVIIPKTADSFDVLDRGGKDVTMSGLKIVTEGSTKDKFDFSLGKYKLLSGKAFEPWTLNIATGSAADTARKDVDTAQTALDAAKLAKTDIDKKQTDLTNKILVLAGLVTKSIVVMPYGVNTLIATFVKDAGAIKLVDVKRFDENGAIVTSSGSNTPTPPPSGGGSTPPGDATLPPPSADSAISEYYKWYWYWNKTGKTASDDYMLKTQIVPPVCPSCPVANCPAAAVVSGSGSTSVSGSASAIAPISDAVKVTGSVAEKTIDTTGNILKSFGSGATSVGLGTVDLAKGTVSETADLAKGAASGTVGLARDVVGETVGLARDVVGGTVGLAKDTVKGTVDLAKDTIGGTVDLARGKYSADEGQRASSGGGRSYSASSHSSMDPYTYNGQLQNKPSADFMPVTANFSAFSR